MKKIILLLLVFIILLVPVMSFAGYAISFEVQQAIDSYQHHIIFHTGENKISVWLKNGDPSSIKVKNSGLGIDGIIDLCYRSEDNGLTWERLNGGNHGAGFNMPYGTPVDEIILESTFDVKKVDGTLFFSPPTPPIPILVAGMMGADSGMILRTISHGLILVSGCLILAISFRKAWAFLHSQLQH